MRYFSFKILILCILLPPVLYLVTIQSIKNYAQGKYSREIENKYLGDTRPLLDGSVRLKDAVNENIDRYLKSKALIGHGLKVNVTVATKKGTLLYPDVFEQTQDSLLPSDFTQVAADNYKLMNQGILTKLEVQVEYNALLSNILLVFYISLFVVILYFHYRAGARKIQVEDAQKEEEIERLKELEIENTAKLNELIQSRESLLADLKRIKSEYETEKNKAIRSEDEMIEEIVSLEEKLDQNLALQKDQEEKISALEEEIKGFEKGKRKDEKQKIKATQSISKRFSALYKNISINERAISGFIDLNEDLKIKAEETIHQLNEKPDSVLIKRKVFVGKRDRKTVLEVIFGYKGRLYYRNLKDSTIEVLAIGTKNTQAKEMEFLNKL